MTFGRKGLGPGEVPANGLAALRNTAPRPISHSSAGVSRDDEIARKRDAFLAAERARKAELGGGGLSEPARAYAAVRPERSLPMAYLLWFVLGQVSAHRFYLGRYSSALVQFGMFLFALMLILSGSGETPLMGLLVGGAWALWVLGDVFFIHRLHREHCRRPGEAAAVFA